MASAITLFAGIRGGARRTFFASFLMFVLVETGSAQAAPSSPTWYDYSTPPQVSLAPSPEFVPPVTGFRTGAPGREAAELPDHWTNETLRLIVKYQLNPLRASRLLAYVHTAMDDALHFAMESGVAENALPVPIHRAASATLAYFFPYESTDSVEAAGFAVVVRHVAASRVEPRETTKGWLIGNRVAAAAISRARDDGADGTWNPNDRPKAARHVWRATPPLFSYNPAEPLAGRWRTWTLKDGSEATIEAPVAFGSEAFWKEAREVKAVSEALTADQKRVAEEWNLDLGTVTPGGVWNKAALRLAREEALDLRTRTRLLAVLNSAIADSFIACWHAKFTWWTVRPITVIQESIDPKFTSHVLTPAFPSYPSGHATISGTAAAVLERFIPKRRAEFQGMADEAAMSRLYGGIHFASDNAKGLELGRSVARISLERRKGALGDVPGEKPPQSR